MRSFGCLSALILALSELAFPQDSSAQIKTGQKAKPAAVMRTAAIIGIANEFKELAEMSLDPLDPGQVLSLHQEISEKVLAASLQVDATTAQIDNEIAQANELRGYLSNRRDGAVNRANLLSIVAGGALGASSAGLQLASGQNRSSSLVGIAAGVVSSGLTISGIRAQKGESRIFAFDSNMLAKLFDLPTLPDSEYGSIVWNFLNDVAATDPDQISRKDRLLRTWASLQRIDAPSSSTGKDKIKRVTSQPSEKIRLTIDDLEDRAAMLEDVRAKLSFLKRDLAALLLALPQR